MREVKYRDEVHDKEKREKGINKKTGLFKIVGKVIAVFTFCRRQLKG